MKKHFSDVATYASVIALMCGSAICTDVVCNAMVSAPDSLDDILLSAKPTANSELLPEGLGGVDNNSELLSDGLSEVDSSSTLLSDKKLDTEETLEEEVPILLSSLDKQAILDGVDTNLENLPLLSKTNKTNDISTISFDYVYDHSVAERLNLESELVEVSNGLVIQYLDYNSSVGDLQQNLNSTLYSIYDKYVQETCLPIKDPLWLIALGSVEYNYQTNDSGLFFSFPVNMEKAAANPNYLLEYSWKEVQSSFGTSAVTRRDGSSIGILQLTSGFAANVNPVIQDDFGYIGSVDGRRSDAWVTLGACTDSGSSIVWKPGVNGDRWSPADCANITYAVYDYTINASQGCMDVYNGKYEHAIILMWGHNRGTGIINTASYRERTKTLATYVPELQEFLAGVQPDRFTRASVLISKCSEIAGKATGGDTYPVMALMSYLITEARYEGKW